MAEMRQRPLTATPVNRASDTPPFKPYTYGGEIEEPPAVTAARERHRAVTAAITERQRQAEAALAARLAHDEESAPDPSPEWYRELADEFPMPPGVVDRALAAVPDLPPDPDPEPEPQPDPEPEPDPEPARCGACGYLTGTIGHKVACDA